MRIIWFSDRTMTVHYCAYQSAVLAPLTFKYLILTRGVYNERYI